MTQPDCEPVAVSRTIASSARDIFRILSDPATHCLIDGSAMLRDYASDAAITGIGEVFVMNMNNTGIGYHPRYRDLRLLSFACLAAQGCRQRQAMGRGHDNDS